MSLNVTLNTATSGMMAAQAGLRAVSDNIANVNTPGYVRKTVDQRPMVVNGVGMGVEVVGVTRVTDQYLQLASLSASSDSSRWDVFSQYLDNAQSLFGDPSSDTFFFNRLDQTFASFATAANDPSSSLQRSQSISNVQDFLAEAGRINGQIGELGRTVDGRVQSDVDRANDLLSQIDQLNVDISRAKVVDRDASGSENIQAQLVDQLATIMTIKLSPRQGGGVDIRSPDGVQLAGGGAAVLSYNRTDSTHGYISAKPASGSSAAFPIQIDGGEMRGLMDPARRETAGDVRPAGRVRHPRRRSAQRRAQRLILRASAWVPDRPQYRPRPAHRRQRLHRQEHGGHRRRGRGGSAQGPDRLRQHAAERRWRRALGLHRG
jgi:flagellar hook-associated protein 1 FlgK